MADISDCPGCNRKTLVNRKLDLFECLDCGFKKDFSKPETPVNNTSDMSREIISGLALGFIIYLIYVSSVTPSNSSRPKPHSGFLPTKTLRVNSIPVKGGGSSMPLQPALTPVNLYLP